MATQSPISMVLAKVSDKATNDNFTEVKRTFDECSPIISGAYTGDLTLVTGINLIAVPGRIKNPRGRIVCYQTAAANLTDAGIDSNGKWQLTASAPCTVRLLFF